MIDEIDKIRLKTKRVKLSNQKIIELAYLIKETLEDMQGQPMFFEQANCYSSCFHTIRELLKQVDAEYLSRHYPIRDFYQRERIRFDGNCDSLDSISLAQEAGNG